MGPPETRFARIEGDRIAYQVLGEGAPGPVLTIGSVGKRRRQVTRTVRDLATGTDLAFTSRGSVGLRGVPGEWELFEAAIA
ncbi:MAG: hypothetical protein ACRDKS_03195 [Actinomycetota bacterium]